MKPADSQKAPPVYDMHATAEGFVLRRNRQAMKTPAGVLLALPTEALAEAIAGEWRAAGGKLKPGGMPLMQLAATALDLIAPDREKVVTALAAVAGGELLCHRADQPPELVERQKKIWQPWLEWAARRFGAVLRVGEGVMPVAQPEAALSSLRAAAAGYDAFHLAGLQQAVGITGSLILGLALAEGEASASKIFNAAELDSLFQVEQWGDDPVTAERHAAASRELAVCTKWFALLGQQSDV